MMDQVEVELVRKMRNCVCDILVKTGLPEELSEEIVEKMTPDQLRQFLINLLIDLVTIRDETGL